MTTLTKQDRETAILSIMRESYASRFAELADKLVAHAKATLRAQHPKFYELLRDEESRKYLDVGQHLHLQLELSSGKCGARIPNFNAKPKFDKLHSEYWYSFEGAADIRTGLSHPSLDSTVTVQADHHLANEYDSLWGAFEDAWNTVEATLYGYKVRERFEADFPELAKHLPKRSVVNALTVPVADIRAKLQAAGIPPVLQGA